MVEWWVFSEDRVKRFGGGIVGWWGSDVVVVFFKYPPKMVTIFTIALVPVMKTIQTTVEVKPDHQLTIALPPDIEAGAYQVVIVFEAQPVEKPLRQPFKFPVDNYGILIQEPSLSREEMYGEFGR